jgi:large subunit ribosomal protein L4
MKLAVLDQTGKSTGKEVTLAKDIFGLEPNQHAIYLDVKQYLANQRQGTHKAKERGEIARTTKKFFRQKGTGNARVGSLRSPIQRGGGTTFGPRPRDYRFKLNKKLKAVARKSALSAKAASKDITVLDKLTMEKVSTKDFVAFLEAMKSNTKKTLVVIGGPNKSVYLSSRNFKGAEVVTALQLNTYSVLNAQKLIITEDSLEKLETVLRK